MPKRKKVALLIESSRAYGRGLLRGVASYLHAHPDWSVYLQSRSPEDPPPPWLEGWNGHGIIARVESRSLEAAIRATGLPAVDLRGAFDLDMPLVETNEHSTCQLAFDHLRSRGFRQLAFCGFEGANYSERRLRYFRDLAVKGGLSLQTYQSPLPGRAGAELMLSSREELALLSGPSLTRWLQVLPKPVGLFACNDVCGQQVLNACREAGLAVPEQIAVLGVDNDTVHCELSEPPLSSIQLNTQKIGHVAAHLLNGMMEKGLRPPPKTFVDAIGLVVRQSTDIVAVDDPVVAKAVRFIRQSAGEPITVDDVVRAAAVSRRQLERRFQVHLQRTPKDEIQRVRIRRIKDLLTGTDVTLAEIADKVGFDHPEYLSTMFKKEVGMTPMAYRAAQKS
ncbi:MAG: substrate-binding domain-containing protein [Verrucomicrobiales bacterium]